MNKAAMLFFALAVSLAPRVGVAAGISGFQDFQFGMRLAEVQDTETLTPSSDIEEGRWFKASETATILGNDYGQELLFNRDDILIQVNVSRQFEGIDVACTGAFDEVFGAIRATYGEPDQQPERTVHGGIAAITVAHFTQGDGSRVILSAIFLNNCTVNVAYISSPGGAGF